MVPLDILTYEEAMHRAQLCEQDVDRITSEFGKVGKVRDKDKKRPVMDRGFSYKGAKRFSRKRSRIKEIRERTVNPPMYPAIAPTKGLMIGW